MNTNKLPRRTFLASSAAAAGGLLPSSAGPHLDAQAAPVASGAWSSSTTENGWPVLLGLRFGAIHAAKARPQIHDLLQN